MKEGRMRVFLCEKPKQGRDVAGALGLTKNEGSHISGNNIAVVWAIGHLLSQSKPEFYEPNIARDKKGWDLSLLPIIPTKWRMELPDPKVDAGRYKQAMAIKNLLLKATEVVIATDNDREGETIACELLEFFNYKGKTLRMKYSSMDKQSLRKALDTLVDGKETYTDYIAGVGRMRADWLFGMNMTIGLTAANKSNLVIGDVLSAGRVQSPIVYLVVARELEIKNFVPVSFYKIDADFIKKDTGEKYSGSLKIRPELLNPVTGYLDDQEKLKTLMSELRSQKTAKVTKYDTTEKSEKAPIGYALSDLQKECSKRFGFSAKKTLELTQKLYDTYKLVTYPRSDCGYASENQFKEADGIISKITSNFANQEYADLSKLLNTKIRSRMWNTALVTAHHAIMPTITDKKVASLSKDEAAVYDLVCKRYMMQFMVDYRSSNVSIETTLANEIFQTYGNTTVEMGWKMADPKLNESNKSVPLLVKGVDVEAVKVKERSEQTKPPSSYTEDALLDDMVNIRRFIENEKLKKIIHKAGIGTEATRAEHLENVKRKGYIKENGKKLLPTDKAFALMEVLPDILRKPETTAYWEEELNQVVLKTRTLEQFMGKVEGVLHRMMKQVKDGECLLSKPVSNGTGRVELCKECNAPIKRIKTKVSKKNMWICGGCNSFFNDVAGRCGEKIVFVEQPKGDFPCQVCNKSQMLRKKKRDVEEFFWVCEDKKCGVFAKDNNGVLGEFQKPKVKEVSEHTCPKCKGGYLIKRIGVGGKNDWWGCNNYPKCKTTFQDKEGLPNIEIKKSPPSNAKVVAKSDYPCKVCGVGYLTKRSGANGKKDWWGCNNYPKCKTTCFDDNGKPQNKA